MSIAKASTADLRKMVAVRERAIGVLLRKRDTIDARLAELGHRGGRGSAASRRRPKNERTLADALAVVLKGKTMRVTEAADAVLASGYKSVADPLSFRTMVNQALLNRRSFKRVGRGEYTAKERRR